MSATQTSAGAQNGTPGSSGYIVSDLVGLALRQIGVGAMGTGPSPQDLSDGVMHLNMLLAQWQRRRWMVPNLVDAPVIATGASRYLVGPGLDFDTPVRPDRIEAAYVRWTNSPGFTPASLGDFSAVDFSSEDHNTTGTNGLDAPLISLAQFTGQFAGNEFPTQTVYGEVPRPLDFPLAIISSYEDYSAIGLKGLTTWPSAVYYSPEWPAGELKFWPIPQANLWELHILYKDVLPTSLALADSLSVPPEYWDAIMWSLAARLAPSYGMQPDQTVVAMARSALQTIKLANHQTPRLQMPGGIGPRIGAGGSPWWINTGGFY